MNAFNSEYGKQMAQKIRSDLDALLQEYEFQITDTTSAQELDDYLKNYNWDDGFSVPYLIVTHPNCELATAVNAFWLSEGSSYFKEGFLSDGGEAPPWKQNWRTFVTDVTENILNNHYRALTIGFPPCWRLSKAQLSYRNKRGWEMADGIPDIFYGLGEAWNHKLD